jgi:hypothetical protein
MGAFFPGILFFGWGSGSHILEADQNFLRSNGRDNGKKDI